MPQLIMHGPVYQNGYNTTEMFASISYGSLDKPCDHEGNEITEPSPSFDSHLIKNVIPHLKRALKDSEFELTDKIDNPYESILPALILKKKSGTEASEAEMLTLTALLTEGIKTLKVNNDKKEQSARLFHHPASAASVPAAAAVKNSRPRQRH